MGEDRVSGQRGWVAIGVVILLAAGAPWIADVGRRPPYFCRVQLLDTRRFRRKPRAKGRGAPRISRCRNQVANG
jgi:hypothetical protein